MNTLHDLERALTRKEHEHLEFKEARSSYSESKLVEYCVALASEGGGAVIFGVSDKLPRQVVGTLAFQDTSSLKKKIRDQLHFRVDFIELDHPDGRVLIASIPSRPVGVPVHIEGRYLCRIGESLMPMTPDQLRSIFNESPSTSAVEPTTGFACGKRVKRIREDLSLKASHMAEITNMPSENFWRAVEIDDVELSATQLTAISTTTGTTIEWLKHGDGEPYSTGEINDFSWEEDLQSLVGSDSFDLAMVLDAKTMCCCLLAKRSDYRVDAYVFSFNIAFWLWGDDHHHIPEIWRCFRWIRSSLGVTSALILPSTLFNALAEGRTSGRSILEAHPPRSRWFDDLFDLAHLHRHLVSEYRAYGPWFSKLQDSIRRWGHAASADASGPDVGPVSS
ncbi:MAG: ATP-binding protein [Alphaproteobacteria bacterium]|nr:MAG: ATP-binding protein [Alphaproteobacteria bacterium]